MKRTTITPKKQIRINWSAISMMVLCAALLALSMILATSPERYNLSVGDIATKTITATKDVVNEIDTELRRERAAEAVQISYKEDEGAITHVLSNLDQFFEEFESVRAYGEGIRMGDIPSAAGEGIAYSGTFQQADLDYANTLAPSISLSNWQLTILMRQTAKDLKDVHDITREAVRKQMDLTIREGQIETALNAIQRQIQPTISTELCTNIAIPAVRASLVPNMIIDQEATEASRAEARQEVEATIYKSGQNIVVSGERVTEAQLAMLESLGLLEGNRFDSMMMVGVSILSILVMLALLFYVWQFDRELMSSLRNMVLLAVIVAVTLLVCVAVTKINPFLAPISMIVLLTTVLLSPSLAVIANTLALIVISVLASTTGSNFAQQMIYIVVTGVLSAPVGILIASKLRQQRAGILLAGLAMAVMGLVGMIAVGLLTNNEMRSIMDKALWVAGGNVLAAILCMGAQPVLEWAFNLVTPFKLIELANPNHPLLRRVLVETPGTYHHSIMVANLAEAAAEAIGANSLLARVGAYYHDIGKLRRPLYFKENQLGDNPHDRTDPRVSAAIIFEHVTDGVHMARQHHIPEAIVDLIAQHHGDTTVSFFLHKMRNMPGGADAREEDFRYPGPKPQTAEAAILMMADTVEAAIRAGGDQPVDVIEKRVRELVDDKIKVGQLSESPLRYSDMEKIIHAFSQVLVGIYHKRIEYPQLQSNMQQLPQIPMVVQTPPPAEAPKPVDETVVEESINEA